jgi:dipeptidyl aminopeptidase/acylaminoacyl peptidase
VTSGRTTHHALSASQVAERATSYDWVTARHGVLAWVQSPSVLRTWPVPLDEAVAGFTVGGQVHAYGGGPYTLTDSAILAVKDDDGQIWQPSTTRRLTDSTYPHADLAWADGTLTCIRETPNGDELVLLDPAPGDGERVVHRADFLAAPRLRGDRLAWMQWDADVVPWDASQIWAATLPDLHDAVRVAGGPGESATQPRWGPDGWLYFMSDRSGWWNLYRWHHSTVQPVAEIPADCAPAPWELGYASYTFLPGGRIAIAAQNGPRYRLLVTDRSGQTVEVETPYTFLKPYLATLGDWVAVIGASPTLPQQIALIDPTSAAPPQIVASSTLPQPAADITIPEMLTVAGITALVYWPACVEPVPLIVRAHAGPTYSSELRFDGEVQYFTSRGYAVADVDYHGSTGYGRDFRKALDGNWGVLDVDDCTSVVRHLMTTGRVRPDAVFISGASAGGYTALRAVCSPDTPFAVAVARSAIVSPRHWTTTAPRFQRPHAAILANHHADVTADQITRPVLLIHGDKDAVAPIGDAARLAADLQDRHFLIERVFLPGVGHYLSRPDALTRALDAELAAYEAVLTAARYR